MSFRKKKIQDKCYAHDNEGIYSVISQVLSFQGSSRLTLGQVKRVGNIFRNENKNTF